MNANSKHATVVGAMSTGEGTNYSPKSPSVIHNYSKVRLFVKKVTGLQVLTNFPDAINGKILIEDGIYYATCTRGGMVDWKDTKIYKACDLVGTDNVFVVGLNRA